MLPLTIPLSVILIDVFVFAAQEGYSLQVKKPEKSEPLVASTDLCFQFDYNSCSQSQQNGLL